MSKKYISKIQLKRSMSWVSLLIIALFVAVGFWIYNIYITIGAKDLSDNRYATQSLYNLDQGCIDRYDYLETDHISYYMGYNKVQLMRKNMQDLSTIIVDAEQNNTDIACPANKACDVNQDNHIDSQDLRFLEQLLRDVDELDDNSIIKLLIAYGLPVDCYR